MNEKKNDGLALVVGGLFILALVFATYNYFNKGKEEQSSLEKKLQEISQEESAKEDASKGDLNGDAASDSKEVVASAQPGTVSASATTTTTPTWTANDYKKGDIAGTSYTVKSGDTLWEIAEAVYGNGAEYTRILAANNGSIGFLPNGTQALITTGQVLVIPGL